MMHRKTFWAGVWLLLLATSGVHGAGEPDKGSTHPATWYTGNRYVWDAPLAWHELYSKLLQRLPPEQARVRSQFAPRDLVPLDCVAGEDRPRLSYVLAHATDKTIGFYSRLPGISYLDLLFSELTDQGLPQLHDCKAQSISFPKNGISSDALLKLLSDDSALPNLQHAEIAPDQAARPNVVSRIWQSRPKLGSVQLTGLAINDEWLRSLKGLPEIHGVRLYDTAVTSAGLPALAELPNLTHVALAYNRRVDHLEWLQKIRNLKELHLQGPTTWSDAQGLTTQEYACLSDEVLKGIENHPSIEVLVLESSHVSEKGMRIVSSLPKLRVLVIKLPKDQRVVEAATKWEKSAAGRRLYVKPQGYLAGWIVELTAEWVQIRGFNPELSP